MEWSKLFETFRKLVLVIYRLLFIYNCNPAKVYWDYKLDCPYNFPLMRKYSTYGTVRRLQRWKNIKT